MNGHDTVARPVCRCRVASISAVIDTSSDHSDPRSTTRLPTISRVAEACDVPSSPVDRRLEPVTARGYARKELGRPDSNDGPESQVSTFLIEAIQTQAAASQRIGSRAKSA